MTKLKTKRQLRHHRKDMHGNAVQAKTVRIHVTRDDIENAECRLGTKCMIKVATKRALNLAHGYIHVDASGIAISRNGSYREKAFMARTTLERMLAFDREQDVKPFSFTATFFKTTKITKARSAEENEAKRVTNIKSGSAKKKYDMRSRVIGVSVAGGMKIAA